jgi:hypothetical protein
MKHAGPAEFDRLEKLLGQLRALAGLKEKSRGTFYRGSRAFLHFHGHGEELYADVRFYEDFERFPVTSATEQKKLLAQVTHALKGSTIQERR